MKRGIFFFLVLIISNSYAQQIVGSWYRLGILQTENSLFSENEWNKRKEKLLQQNSDTLLSLTNYRKDIYSKLNINPNGTFTSRFYDLVSDTVLYGGEGDYGTWTIKSDSIRLIYTYKNYKLSQDFIFNLISQNSLVMKIIKESEIKEGKTKVTYDLLSKKQNFNQLLNEIGKKKIVGFKNKYEEFLEPEPYVWEFSNFLNYFILFHHPDSDTEINKYSLITRKFIKEQDYDKYLPAYDIGLELNSREIEIADSCHVNFIYKDSSNKILNHKYLLSVIFENDKLIFSYEKNSPPPKEIKNFFGVFNTNKIEFNILACNEHIIILEKM